VGLDLSARWPTAIREFARDLREIVVVEEKRGFLESQVKEAAGRFSQSVPGLGKADETGAPLFPIRGHGLRPGGGALRPRLLRLAEGRSTWRRASAPARRDPRGARATARGPSGPDAELLLGMPPQRGHAAPARRGCLGQPGCHSFASIIEQPERHIVSMTQLGGEGLPWIGLGRTRPAAHGAERRGRLAVPLVVLNIRFCVAAGANMTFKILYNGFVANTGAQEMVGGKPVPELTRMLELEGVRRRWS
jgi:indolepyruvate ferredoxin oxidoreductase